MPRQLAIGVGDVDHSNDAVDAKTLGDEEILKQGVEHRRRISQTGRLDQHARKSRDLASPAAHEQVAQAARQVAARAAAQAARGEDDDVVVDLVDQMVIDGDFAELVDQHRRVGKRRLPQEMVEQGRLAGSEEAGEDSYRDRPFSAQRRHGCRPRSAADTAVRSTQPWASNAAGVATTGRGTIIMAVD
jgi:hypothetical protein